MSRTFPEFIQTRLFWVLVCLSPYLLFESVPGQCQTLQIAPFSYIETLSPVFYWTDPVQDQTFEFRMVEANTGRVVYSTDTHFGTEFYLPADISVKPDTLYHWYVRPTTSGEKQTWTGPMAFMSVKQQLKSFTELRPLALPLLRKISGLTSGVTLRWEPLEGSLVYELLIYEAASGELLHKKTGIESTSLEIEFASGFTAGKKYIWKVRGVNALNQSSGTAEGFFTYIRSSASLARMGFNDL